MAKGRWIKYYIRNESILLQHFSDMMSLRTSAPGYLQSSRIIHIRPMVDLTNYWRSSGMCCLSNMVAFPNQCTEWPLQSDHPVIEHFLSCEHEHALDFIQACFQQPAYNGGQTGVNEINEIFHETGIGYELTPFTEHLVKTSLFGRWRQGIQYEFPRVIRRDDQLVHQEIIEPVLKLLSDPRLRVANSEMLKKLFWLCGMVNLKMRLLFLALPLRVCLKQFATSNGRAYDLNRDTCSKLISICRDNDLFPAFYISIFGAVGAMRNKLGDAHGRGPAPVYKVSRTCRAYGPNDFFAYVTHELNASCGVSLPTPWS